jgi:MYXO-CTERM domain-containing protein
MRRIPSAPLATILAVFCGATAWLALGARAARADTVVQIPLPGVLDTRGAFTLTNGMIVPFTLAIDGGNGDVGTGAQNGFATKAVALMKSPGNAANSLPDDGHFPADMNHPEVVLNVSNDAPATSAQNHLVKPAMGATPPGTFTFPVPPATYSKLFLFFHGANGGTTVKITLTYSDATTDVTSATIPDFFNDPTDPKVFVLAGNLAKWTKTTTIAEASHHNIFGVTLAPMAKTLAMVEVERGNNGFLVFWGATGVATSAVTGLPDAGSSGSDAGMGSDAATTGAGGAAGTTGAAGATGAAGTTGAAGATGAAGTTGAAGATGAAGTTGAAGATGAAGTTGAAGMTISGAAGSTGAAGARATDSSGCSCRVDSGAPHGVWLLVGAAVAFGVARRRRR